MNKPKLGFFNRLGLAGKWLADHPPPPESRSEAIERCYEALNQARTSTGISRTHQLCKAYASLMTETPSLEDQSQKRIIEPESGAMLMALHKLATIPNIDDTLYPLLGSNPTREFQNNLARYISARGFSDETRHALSTLGILECDSTMQNSAKIKYIIENDNDAVEKRFTGSAPTNFLT